MGEWNLQRSPWCSWPVMQFAYKEILAYQQRIFHGRCWNNKSFHCSPPDKCCNDNREDNRFTPFLPFRLWLYFFFRANRTPRKFQIHNKRLCSSIGRCQKERVTCFG